MGRSKIISFKFLTRWCKSKGAIDAIEPKKYPSSQTSSTTEHTAPPRSSTTSSDGAPPRTDLSTTIDVPEADILASISISISNPSTTATNVSIPIYTSTSYCDSSTTSTSVKSTKSLSIMTPTSQRNLRDSLYIYYLHEISNATNNFLTNRCAPSSSFSTASWRCRLRGKDAVVFHHKLRRSMAYSQLREMLSLICKIDHKSVIKLLGGSISYQHIFLVYDFVDGVNLANCLRNPSHTVLSTWMSRMAVATNIARGLGRIHEDTGQNIRLVHKYINSSSIVITERSLNAKICHLGMVLLCGEIDENMVLKPSPIGEDSGKTEKPDLMPFEGFYMAPEFQSTGIASQKSDVYAFGLLVLELLSGEDPLECEFDEESGDFTGTSMINTARRVIEGDDGGGGREFRLRMWVDRRLNDSFPVLLAERLTRVARSVYTRIRISGQICDTWWTWFRRFIWNRVSGGMGLGPHLETPLSFHLHAPCRSITPISPILTLSNEK